jgi:hypothetical protein
MAQNGEKKVFLQFRGDARLTQTRLPECRERY